MLKFLSIVAALCVSFSVNATSVNFQEVFNATNKAHTLCSSGIDEFFARPNQNAVDQIDDSCAAVMLGVWLLTKEDTLEAFDAWLLLPDQKDEQAAVQIWITTPKRLGIVVTNIGIENLPNIQMVSEFVHEQNNPKKDEMSL